MSKDVVIILLIINGVLVFVMLCVLLAVLRQGRRIARIARNTQEWAQEAEAQVRERTHDRTPPQGS